MKERPLSLSRKSIAAATVIAAILLGAALPAASQDASANESRIALIIGNGSYSNVPLKNPANDARDLAEALQGLGFSVTLVVDGDLPAMTKAIRDFGNAIKRPDAVALFYYSGHGVQYRGANYLIPAKSDIQDPDELAFSAVNSDQVYAKMESSGDKTNIVILDACRNNPFPGSERAGERGLAIVGTAPPQSVIVYATAPGKTAQDGDGRNGLFTSALLKHIKEPNIDIELMIRKVRADVIQATSGAQVPWNNSSISGSGFAFLRQEQKEPAAKVPASVARVNPDAAAMAPQGKGILTLTSEPAGMRIAIDGGENYETPCSVELEPGAHSFEPLQTVINSSYYGAQPLQWITVSAGTETSIPIRIKPVMAKLAFKHVPPGYTVFIDGESVGETPIGMGGVMDAIAGVHDVRFEKPGERPRVVSAGMPPGGTATVSWGKTKENAYPLQRATVKLDGKPDSWAGIEPLYEADNVTAFLGDANSGIKRVYMCRDDKYLYWRVDFNGNDPLLKRPKGVGNGLNLQFDVWNEGARRNVTVCTQYNSETNAIRWYCGIYSDALKSWNEYPSVDNSGKHTKDMFVGRVAWAWFWENVPAAEIPRLNLVNNDANWQWINSTQISLDLGWIDFAYGN
jgi:hypothetical protein